MEPTELENVVPAYVRAFETLEPDAVVPFYGLPCTFIAPHGVFVVSDAGGARALVEKLVADARSRNYRRTEIPGGVAVRRLAANLAAATGTFVRLDASGKEILRFGFTYLLRDDGKGWRIVVAAAHDPSPPPS